MVESGEPHGGAGNLARLEPPAFASAAAGVACAAASPTRRGSESNLERIVFALVVVFGVIARYRYVFNLHAPRHHVSSDAGEVIELARKFADPHASQSIADTIWPPGTAALLAPLVALDPSLEAAAWLHFLASTATFLLIGYSAYVAAGLRAGQLATFFAAFHFGFVHYGGTFLSEQLFQFAVALALAITVIGVRMTEQSVASARAALRLSGLGALVGLGWGLASMIRPNALPVALMTGAALLLLTLRLRQRCRLPFVAGALLAFVVVLLPLTDRCSELSGRFCLVSNNVAMNVALGQAGEVKGLEFRDAARPELTTSWVPPALLHHGYDAMGSVTRAIYDSPGLLGWVFERLKQDPGMFLVRAAGNALDLFRLEYWPDDFGRLPERAATVAKQAFLLLVVAPGLVAFVQVGLRWRSRARSVLPFVLVAAFGSVVVAAALSMGEPRYRIPFDAVLILLAATMYTRSEASLFEERAVASHAKVVLAVAAAIAALCAILVTSVSHPKLRAMARSDLGPASVTVGRTELRPAREFDRRVAIDSAWDGGGNYRFPCAARCSGLALGFGETQRARTLEITLDHNDAYALRFMRHGREVGAVVISPRPSRGMRRETLSVPETARAGFDQVVLFPLYGDGRYSVGSVQTRS
jgi:hypothetical protein